MNFTTTQPLSNLSFNPAAFGTSPAAGFGSFGSNNFGFSTSPMSLPTDMNTAVNLGSQLNLGGGSNMALGFGAMAGLTALSAGLQGGLGLIGENQRARGQADLFEVQNRAAQDQFNASLGAGFLQNDAAYSRNLQAEIARLNLQRSGLFRDSARNTFNQSMAIAGFSPSRIADFQMFT